MPVDPYSDAVQQANPDPVARLTARVADLERALRNQQRTATIQVLAGAPAGVVREGTPAASTGTPRLWLYLGGTWRFTNLT